MEDKALCTFTQLIGTASLRVKDGYFHIDGVRAVVVDTFNPSQFFIEFTEDNEQWRRHSVNPSRLGPDSKNLLQILGLKFRYKFEAIYQNEECKKRLVSPSQTMEIGFDQKIKIGIVAQKSRTDMTYREDEDDLDMDNMAPLNMIDQVDRALARYYFKQDRNDYFDENGVGIFKLFCEENGFDADVIEEELDNDPSECMLIDVDEEFPFPKPPMDRDKAIYDVLKRCFQVNCFVHSCSLLGRDQWIETQNEMTFRILMRIVSICNLRHLN